jgi:membrane-bound ClpP family serine protease
MRARTVRRSIGVVLVVVGALLMWLSPETLAGAAIAGAGIAIELIGIALERRT